MFGAASGVSIAAPRSSGDHGALVIAVDRPYLIKMA
jgi:hypothetical protein